MIAPRIVPRRELFGSHILVAQAPAGAPAVKKMQAVQAALPLDPAMLDDDARVMLDDMLSTGGDR